MTRKQYFAIFVGVVAFMATLTAICILAALSPALAALPSVLVALEAGWYAHNPRYWSRTHAYPFEIMGLWLIGDRHHRWYGISWIFLVPKLIAAPVIAWWFSRLSTVWLAKLMPLPRMGELLSANADVVALITGVLILMLAIWCFSIAKEEDGPEERFCLALCALPVGVLVGLLSGLLAIAFGIACVFVGMVYAMAFLIGTLVLAGERHLFVVTLGIITGSIGGYLVAGLPYDLMSFTLATGIGTAIGWLLAEGAHRVGLNMYRDPTWRDIARFGLGGKTGPGAKLVPRRLINGRYI